MFKDVFSYWQTIPECRQWYRTECDKEITQIMYITLFRYQAGLAEYRPHHKEKTFIRPFNVSYISITYLYVKTDPGTPNKTLQFQLEPGTGIR